MTIIGIDPHKASLTAVAVDQTGMNLGSRRFAVTPRTGAALSAWAQGFPDPRFAVEGAKGLGHSIAQSLVSRGRDVVDVPATLSMRVRVLETGGSRKSDPDDAQAVEPEVPVLHHGGPTTLHISRRSKERRDNRAPHGA